MIFTNNQRWEVTTYKYFVVLKYKVFFFFFRYLYLSIYFCVLKMRILFRVIHVLTFLLLEVELECCRVFKHKNESYFRGQLFQSTLALWSLFIKSH